MAALNDMQTFSINPMTDNDLPGANQLRRLVGWNQTTQDWKRLLRLAPGGCFVAIRDGLTVGSVTAIAYGQALGWIGMMLVHPAHRRNGIATQLMHRAIQSLHEQQVNTIKLDATPAGLPLYQRLGFISEWSLTRFQLPPRRTIVNSRSPSETRKLTRSDWIMIDRMDSEAIGASRGQLLRGMAKDSVRAAGWPAAGPLQGWGLLRRGANADYLGPVMSRSMEGANFLVATLLPTISKCSVFWDVPDLNQAAQATAQQLGFAPVRPLTRMRLGPALATGGPQAQFAIADPAVG